LGLRNQTLSEFREIFNLVDKDGSGSITKLELSELMETLGINASSEEIDMMISEIDQDGSNDINFDEFVTVMSRKVNSTYSADQVKAAFKVFESNNNGFIKPDLLVKALCTYGIEKLSKEQARELVSQLEVDNNDVLKLFVCSYKFLCLA